MLRPAEPRLRFLKAGIATVADLDMETGNFHVSGSAEFGGLGIGGTPSARHPLTSNLTIDGATFTKDTPPADKVGSALTVTFKGGFGSETKWGQGNPGFIFGANDFIVSGTDAGDIVGITDFIGRLSEVHQNTPNAAVNALIGLQAESAVEEPAVGSVTQAVKSLQVIGPRVRGGQAIDAYSLYVTAPSTSGRGVISGTAESLHVNGATTLNGDVQLLGALSIGAATSTAAAGGASAPLPAAPEGYVSITIGGVVRKVPYYN